MRGLDVEVIMGFKSRANGRMSTMRGETTIDYQTTPAYLKHIVPLVEEGTMVPLFTFGALDANGEIGRDPTLPDLPRSPEAYENVPGKQDRKKAVTGKSESESEEYVGRRISNKTQAESQNTYTQH